MATLAQLALRAGRSRARPRLTPVTGLAITCLVSASVVCVLVGSRVLLHPASTAAGFNPASDFQVMTWSLAWWPWAIFHAVNPLHTQLFWPPEGFSTLWMTTIPVPALLALPITLTAGPLVAYNVLIVLAVPLAAAAAYLLCRELTASVAASVVGGVLFGLSPYMLGHTLSQHLDLTFVFPIPLLALLVIRYVRGRTTARRLLFGFAALLLVQLGSSFELFLDVTVMVVVGFVLAFAGTTGLTRLTLGRAGALVAGAYGVCLPVLVPIAVLALSSAHAPLRFDPGNFAIDVVNMVVPTPTLLGGLFHSAQAQSQHFVGNIGEQDGYLGLPLLIVALLALRAEWRRGAWLAGALLLVALLLSFGPMLTVGGRALVGLPFALARLPVLRGALPARLSVFTALAAACLCAMWLARPRPRWRTVGAGVVLVVSLLPNFGSPQRIPGAWGPSYVFRWSTARAARFDRTRPWTRVLASESNVLVLPTGDRTPASYWQAMSNMRFRLAVPATPFVPPSIAAAPVVRGLVNDDLPALAGRRLAAARLRAFLNTQRIQSVVVSSRANPSWRAVAAAATASRPIALGDMEIFHVPSTLQPLRASGDSINVRRGTGLKVWLAFDGTRARVRVRLRPAEGRAFGSAVTLSSPTGDADMTAAAVGARGRAAVAFTEWQGHRTLLRVATHRQGRWRVDTLDSQRQPIWSPQLVITRNGTTLAAWVDEADPFRAVRAAALSPNGRWQRTVTLERGNGFGTIALSATSGLSGVCAWRDAVAGETRLRLATFDGVRWRAPATLMTSLARIGRVVLLGRTATVVRWSLEDLDHTRPQYFEAHRKGTSWTSPHVLELIAAAHLMRHRYSGIGAPTGVEPSKMAGKL
jgi:hypothetical protein